MVDSPACPTPFRLGDRTMFDILKLTENGERVWIEAATSLEDAMARVKDLWISFPGSYVVHSHATGKDIQFNVDGGIRRR